MNCVILQNSYCACIDLAAQLRSLIPEVAILFMTEEALEMVYWLQVSDTPADCIIADTEACDGDTITIFRRSEVREPLILTCSSPEEAHRSQGLNLIGLIMKPFSRQGLKRALSSICKEI